MDKKLFEAQFLKLIQYILSIQVENLPETAKENEHKKKKRQQEN